MCNFMYIRNRDRDMRQRVREKLKCTCICLSYEQYIFWKKNLIVGEYTTKSHDIVCPLGRNDLN